MACPDTTPGPHPGLPCRELLTLGEPNLGVFTTDVQEEGQLLWQQATKRHGGHPPWQLTSNDFERDRGQATAQTENFSKGRAGCTWHPKPAAPHQEHRRKGRFSRSHTPELCHSPGRYGPGTEWCRRARPDGHLNQSPGPEPSLRTCRPSALLVGPSRHHHHTLVTSVNNLRPEKSRTGKSGSRE